MSKEVGEIFEVIGAEKFLGIFQDMTGALLATPEEVRERLGIDDRRAGEDRRKEDVPARDEDRRTGERRARNKTSRPV